MSLRGGKAADEEEEEELLPGREGTLATISASSCGADEAFPCPSMSKTFSTENGIFVPRARVGLLLGAASSATGVGRGTEEERARRLRG